VLLLPAGVALLPDSGEQAEPMPVATRAPASSPTPGVAVPMPVSSPPQAGAENARAPAQTEEEAPELPDIEGEEWRAGHGYFSPAEHALYASYTDQAIRELAATGDLLAAEVLFNRYVAAGNWQAARLAAMVGAVHGSTAALGLIAEFHEQLALQLGDRYPNKAKKVWLSALSALEVGLMRGDPNAYARGIAIIRSEELTLSADDLQAISRAGTSLYQRLSRERNILGLPPFDDPPVERFSARVALDESVNWGKAFFTPDDKSGEEDVGGQGQATD
jgi:hypothetical protein